MSALHEKSMSPTVHHHCSHVATTTNSTFYSLRRRFEQNQEDCTFTVLAILHTATENVIEALPVEKTVDELQREKEERATSKGSAMSEVSTADLASVPGSEDARSLTSFKTDSYVHASQMADSAIGDGEQKLKSPILRTNGRRSALTLWNEMKISCKLIFFVPYCD
jgi:peroxin-3